MPHVSGKKLDSDFSDRLFKDLIGILAASRNKNLLSKVAHELFTETEKLMLAKRIAIILMIQSQTPQQKIVGILKVSPSTVAKMSLYMEIGKYASIVKISRKEKIDLERVVWGILTIEGFVPPKYGRKYWKKYSQKIKT
jgi:hypothetical protein